MSLKLYNSLSRTNETFTPITPAKVGMYVCGPTVYDFAHLGNARPVVVFDILYRHLKRHYEKVIYVRNITDVDDKIMQRAQESNEPIHEITERTTKAYHEDMQALLTLPPDIEPRATAHIGEMLAMIALLIEKNHAYVADGHVLFHVPSMKEYGMLSRKDRDELIAGARIDVAPYKKDAADFVLWKPSSAEQVGWDSPFGRGRPGWHIECSAMAKQHLGISFDIHGGGLDLIFPHHENEMAQSHCAHDGACLARFWMHNGFLSVDGEKMSKSLGNFFTVRELLAVAPGEALRLALLSAHYRQPLDFSLTLLQDHKAILDRWYGALRGVEDIVTAESDIPEAIEAALNDDLNTPKAIAALHALAAQLNKAGSLDEKAKAKAALLKGAAALGLLTQSVEAWFRWQAAGKGGLSDAEIEAKIEARQLAKKNKDFQQADALRQELIAAGVQLEDSSQGTKWRRV